MRRREFIAFVGGAATWPLGVALLLDRPQIGTHRPRFLLTELDGGHVGMARPRKRFEPLTPRFEVSGIEIPGSPIDW
jgi:hypothetical protein